MQAQMICQLASQIAKGGRGMVQIAGQFLNLVLEDLVLNKDLKVNRVTQPLTLLTGSYGPFTLEADYLRTYDLFYPIPTTGLPFSSGITQILTPITMEQFDAEFKDPSMANYPYEFATDLSTSVQIWDGNQSPPNATPGQFTGEGALVSAGQLFVYPQSSGVIQATHRYMKKQPVISSPESSSVTPWFTYTQYLIHATAAYMMGFTGDDREAQYHKEADEMLRPHLIMQGDEQAAVNSIRLDPRHFRFARNLKPTKAAPF